MGLAVRVARLAWRQPERTADLIRDSYDRIAAGYDRAWTTHMRDLTRALLDRLAPPTGAACIDLACGTGFATGELARRTGGLYFRATDAKTLEETFTRIDGMEKTEVSSTHWIAWDDLYLWFLLPAAGLLALELLLSAVILRRLP